MLIANPVALSGLHRKIAPIRPEAFCCSYRSLVRHDFRPGDLENQYTNGCSSEGNSKDKEHSDMMPELLAKINITREAMDYDKDNILQVNFPAVSSILLEFLNALSDHMGWEDTINKVVRTAGTRKGTATKDLTSDLGLSMRQLGFSHIWGLLLSCIDRGFTDPLIPENDVEKVSTFTELFFENLEKKRYIFFVKEEIDPTSNRRNPLKGMYPYGRTGKKPSDPLQAYWHVGACKRGTLVSRLVTPGRLALVVEGPFVCQGEKKLKRGSSGKYRHIDLQWDGSVYFSERGSHAAKGYHVPFIPGYDSDSADEYEPIDVKRGKQEGTIGLSDDQVGLFVSVPGTGLRQLLQLRVY